MKSSPKKMLPSSAAKELCKVTNQPRHRVSRYSHAFDQSVCVPNIANTAVNNQPANATSAMATSTLAINWRRLI